MGVGKTPTFRQLCSQLEDYRRYSDLPKGMLPRLTGAKDAREEENVSNNSPGAGLSLMNALMSCRASRDRLSLWATSPIT